MEQALVSVVIPIFNAEIFLEKCLDSVLAQSCRKLEVILVDDGSTDKSSEICRRYQARDARVRLISQENQGVSTARNVGIECSRGQYITFVDADDWIERDHIFTLVKELEEHQADCAVCGYWIDYPGCSEPRTFPQVRRLSGADAQEKMLYPDLFQGFLWNKMFRLDLIRNEHILLQRELTHYEDLVFCSEYFLRSRWVSVADGATYHYRQHSASAIGYRKTDDHWLAGRMSAVKALERVSMMCEDDRTKRLCMARKHMEYADVLRRMIAADVMRDRRRALKRSVRTGIGNVLLSPLKWKFKIKYLITAMLPVTTARFWVKREDRNLT